MHAPQKTNGDMSPTLNERQLSVRQKLSRQDQLRKHFRVYLEGSYVLAANRLSSQIPSPVTSSANFALWCLDQTTLWRLEARCNEKQGFALLYWNTHASWIVSFARKSRLVKQLNAQKEADMFSVFSLYSPTPFFVQRLGINLLLISKGCAEKDHSTKNFYYETMFFQ